MTSKPLCACGCAKPVRRNRNTYLHGHNRRKETLAQRFWAMVKRSDGCWEWTGATHEFGYGVITDRGTGRHLRAHRLSWEMAHGAIPAGQLVLHRCDNPRCVRPDHLFLGDHADNTRDKVQKGRHRFGVKSPLTAADVLEIRHAAADTRTRRSLAERFGVRRATICGIQARRVWTTVAEAGVA